jgi:hypothetical protein
VCKALSSEYGSRWDDGSMKRQYCNIKVLAKESYVMRIRDTVEGSARLV